MARLHVTIVTALDAVRVTHDLETGTHLERVRRGFRGGVRSGVNGTPNFFLNGVRYDGNWTDEEQFIQDLRGVLQSASRT